MWGNRRTRDFKGELGHGRGGPAAKVGLLLE